MNNRRKLLVALGAGALATPFGSLARQQQKVYRMPAMRLIRETPRLGVILA